MTSNESIGHAMTVERSMREPSVMAVRRAAAQISQAELARRCGVTRQFINLVESGRTQPNVQVALKVAAELGSTVEALFGGRETEVVEETPVRLASRGLRAGARLNLARGEEGWTGHAADTVASLGGGFGEADAVLVEVADDGAGSARVEPGRSLDEAACNVAIAGCDPALALLMGTRVAPGLMGRCFWVNCGSGRALELLAAGQVHVAGLHAGDDTGEGNLREVARVNPEGSWQVVRFTQWEQGWMVRPGMGRRFSEASDLGGGGLRLANREEGSGSRRWLDGRLGELGLSGRMLPGYGREFGNHWECARALLAGEADVAVGPRAVAAVAGLEFMATGMVAFDLVVPKALLEMPRIAAVLESLRGRRLRGEIESLPGYRASQAGVLRVN